MIPPWFWVVCSILALGLLAILLFQMYVRGSYRALPFLAAYVSILFITAIVDMTFLADAGTWAKTPLGTRVYWVDDSLRQIALFLVIISMIYKMGAGSVSRSAQRRVLAALLLVIGIASFFLYHQDQIDRWFTPLMRNLSFVAAIFNFVLWMSVARGRVERRVALIVAGIGLQMAGEAIGQSLRVIALAHHNYFLINVANLFLSLSYFLCLLVWMHALRDKRSPKEPARTAVKDAFLTTPH
jgi:hypothetical protein